MTTAGTFMGGKGIDPITGLVVVIILAVLVIEAFYTANIVISTNAVRQDARETAAISVINGMEFLKRSMQEGVTYATERATYDVLRYGGYDSVPADVGSYGCEPYWRKYAQTTVPDFKANLESAIAYDFECYGMSYGSAYPKVGQGVSLSVPSYSRCGSVSVADKGDSIGVSITSKCDRGLEASNEFMTVREGNANFEADVAANMFGFVAAAKGAFVDSDPVADAIERATNGFSCKNLEDSETVKDGSPCSYEGMDDQSAGEALFAKECGNAGDRMRRAIVSELSSVDVPGATASYDIPSNRVSVGHSVEGCTVCERVETTIYKCKGEVVNDCEGCADGECTTENVLTGYVTTCSYTFSADADVEVVLSPDSGKKYPIYDLASKSVGWREMQLRFRVLDGMIGSLQAGSAACNRPSYC